MNDVAALILSYGTTDFLAPCIRQYKWLNRVLVMNYLFKESKPFDDNTPSICMREGAQCKIGAECSQEDVLNRGLDLLRDYKLVFISDNDEFILKKDQLKLIKEWKRARFQKALIPVIDYYKSLYQKYQQRTHCPIVLAEPNTRFHKVRNSIGGTKYFNDIYLHHLGYLFSPEQMKWKKEKQDIINPDGFEACINRPIEDANPPEELVKLLQEA